MFAESRSGRNRVRSIGWAATRSDAARFHRVRIYCLTVEFDVQMGRDTAKLLLIGSADPIRVLHGGQRERRLHGLRPERSAGATVASSPLGFNPLASGKEAVPRSTVGLADGSAKVMPEPRLRQPPASAIMRIEFKPNWIKSSWSANVCCRDNRVGPRWSALISSLLIRRSAVRPKPAIPFYPRASTSDAPLPELRKKIDIRFLGNRASLQRQLVISRTTLGRGTDQHADVQGKAQWQIWLGVDRQGLEMRSGQQ